MKGWWWASFVVTCALAVGTSEVAGAAKPVVLVSPAGGEFYVIGSQQRVRLDAKTRARSITVELSRDGGATFTSLGTIDNTVKDKGRRNVLPFDVTGPASGHCVIRVTANGVATLSTGFLIGDAPMPVGPTNPVTPDGISSGDASGGTVLSSDGQGGTAFQSLDGTYVRVDGDDMTGGLSVAGSMGIGTTTPRGTLELADPTETRMVHAAGAPGAPYVQWVTDAFTHRLQLVSGNSTYTAVTMDFASSDMRYGSVTNNSGITARGNGSVTIDGALSLEAINRTADFVANDATCVFFCNTTSNNITITLPSALGRAGRLYLVKKTSANNTLTLATTNAETIDGFSSISMLTNNSVRLVMSNGTNWFVVSSQ